ncbi:MAG: hypothetical protein C0507_08275 [Cyanobacteria bacterium PR.3.49]|jgi:hypothetical protein|nr:hypothetical protein [Cyanobacteria bacterium PR.3.49]
MKNFALLASILVIFAANLSTSVLAKEESSGTEQPVPRPTNSAVTDFVGDPLIHDKTYVPTEAVKLEPIEELKPWFAECSRQIRRKWAANQTLKQTICTFELANDGSVQKLKTVKAYKTGSAKVAESVLQTASPFRKAPNHLPYTKKIRIEFSEYPNLSLRFN